MRANRELIKRNLFTINPCVSKMLELWETIYTKHHFVRVNELAAHSGSYDLIEFTVCQIAMLEARKCH